MRLRNSRFKVIHISNFEDFKTIALEFLESAAFIFKSKLSVTDFLNNFQFSNKNNHYFSKYYKDIMRNSYKIFQLNDALNHSCINTNN